VGNTWRNWADFHVAKSVTIQSVVMPGLVPGIHVFTSNEQQDVDGRDEPGHDG
jgi:hypothetical protein